MPRSSFRRNALLLLLTAVLATPLTAAAGPRHESLRPAKAVEPAPLDLWSRAWSFLRSVWNKEGCHIDPSGLCVSKPAQQPTSETDAGCNIDPGGLCHS